MPDLSIVNPRGDVLIDGAKLREIRRAKFATQDQFAALIGRSSRWVQEVERVGVKPVMRHVLGIVASKLGLEPDELIAPVGDPVGSDERYEIVSSRQYPVFDVTISATEWIDSVEQDAGDAIDHIVLPSDIGRDAFVIRIHGRCMEPDYLDGSTIVFVPVREGESSSLQFENGRDYYVEHSDGKSTFKRVFYEQDEERFKLMPVNKDYKPFYVPAQMVARMSRARKVIRDV